MNPTSRKRGMQNRRCVAVTSVPAPLAEVLFRLSTKISIVVVLLVSILKLLSDTLPHNSVTVVAAFKISNHRRMVSTGLQPLSLSSSTKNKPIRNVGTRRVAKSITLLSPRTSITQLTLMNWFGFGNNNSDGDDGNGKNESKSSPQDASTMLLSLSPKDSGRNNNNSGSKGGSTTTSSSGVVTIMDSMDQLKRSQRIGKITATVVQELKSIMVEGSSENGKVKIVVDGQQNPISTYIDENYFREQLLQQQQQQRNNNYNDTTELTNAMTAAMKDARMKSIEKMNEKMKTIYNELGFYSNNASQ